MTPIATFFTFFYHLFQDFWLDLLMRTGGVTKIILCADHFYNKIIACFCAILRIYAPSLEGSKDAFRHELIVFQTSKLAEKAPIQRASCLGSTSRAARASRAKREAFFSRQRGNFFF